MATRYLYTKTSGNNSPSLNDGDIAINLADKQIYIKDTDGEISTIIPKKISELNNDNIPVELGGGTRSGIVHKGGGNSANGPYCVALGYRNNANGMYALAEGSGTTASGLNSHSEGANTVASNYSSHAEGRESTASSNSSHAEGYHTTASGSASHAEGTNAIASGGSSHAEGLNTKASGSTSHAEGEGTIASEKRSHAEGYRTRANGYSSHAEGESTTANSNCSHAEGYNTNALCAYSHTEGSYTNTIDSEEDIDELLSNAAKKDIDPATNRYQYYQSADVFQIRLNGEYVDSVYRYTGGGELVNYAYLVDKKIHVFIYEDDVHCIDYINKTVYFNISLRQLFGATSSHAEGYYTTASGSFSHAEGYHTIASDNCSHAEGYRTTANGSYSHAEGCKTTTNKSYSHAEGRGTVTNNENEHACGRYNVSTFYRTNFGNAQNTLFSVGNGTEDERHNAFEIRQNGDIYIADTSGDERYDKKGYLHLQELLIKPITIFISGFNYEQDGQQISLNVDYYNITDEELFNTLNDNLLNSISINVINTSASMDYNDIWLKPISVHTGYPRNIGLGRNVSYKYISARWMRDASTEYLFSIQLTCTTDTTKDETTYNKEATSIKITN